jgi:hypothetical protein
VAWAQASATVADAVTARARASIEFRQKLAAVMEKATDMLATLVPVIMDAYAGREVRPHSPSPEA